MLVSVYEKTAPDKHEEINQLSAQLEELKRLRDVRIASFGEYIYRIYRLLNAQEWEKYDSSPHCQHWVKRFRVGGLELILFRSTGLSIPSGRRMPSGKYAYGYDNVAIKVLDGDQKPWVYIKGTQYQNYGGNTDIDVVFDTEKSRENPSEVFNPGPWMDTISPYLEEAEYDSLDAVKFKFQAEIDHYHSLLRMP